MMARCHNCACHIHMVLSAMLVVVLGRCILGLNSHIPSTIQFKNYTKTNPTFINHNCYIHLQLHQTRSLHHQAEAGLNFLALFLLLIRPKQPFSFTAYLLDIFQVTRGKPRSDPKEIPEEIDESLVFELVKKCINNPLQKQLFPINEKAGHRAALFFVLYDVVVVVVVVESTWGGPRED